MRLERLSLFAALSLSGRLAIAQPVPESSIPGPLRDWIPWVLDGAEERRCPALHDAAVCLWPGRLTLTATAGGARFSLEVEADRTLAAPLPGDARRWPLEVHLDGSAAAVLEAQSTPRVRLGSGRHRIEGRFEWDRLPDSLPVPPAVAIVDLTVEGRAIAVPSRDESGLLLLRQPGASAGEAENLQVRVFRRISDGIPLFVETRLVLDASGRAREVSFPSAQLPGSSLHAVSGELPARADASGQLRIQVRAGTYSVTLLSRLNERGERIARMRPVAPWPAQEVWTFAAAERLRQVEITGAPAIDAARTDLPNEWRELPAYLIEGDAALVIKEVRRGEPDSLPDQLHLGRTLWLDEAGAALTVRDTISGQLGRSTRLGLLASGELGRVSIGGAGQLVTVDPRDGRPGIEVRQRQIQIEADSRWPRGGRLPAVGWSIGVQTLQAQLLLPPGWRLLGALGVDSAPGSWLGSWNLYAFFFVVITTLAAYRLLGARLALIVLAVLVLAHAEQGAPEGVWLFLVAALALLRVAPPGAPQRIVRVVGALGLLALALTLPPFFADQLVSGFYPQVGGAASAGVEGGVVGGVAGGAMDAVATRALPAAPPPQAVNGALQSPMEPKVAEESLDRLKALGYLAGRADQKKRRAPRRESNVLSESYAALYATDPHAVVQTGAGVPDWSWRSYNLGWSGPVAKEHTLRLLLVSPTLNLLFALTRVALFAWLALRLTLAFFPTVGARLPVILARAGLALVLACGCGSALAAQEAASPDPTLLQELRTRLTRPPACAPNCVSTSRLHLVIDGATLRVEAEVHAGAAAPWPLPGPAAAWVPRSVRLDGRPVEGSLARLAGGMLYLRLPEGVHRVVASGPLPPRDSLTLQFGVTPRRATASAPGWQVDGIREDGGAEASIQLSRRLDAADRRARGGSYEPWLEVTRVLEIGVSWEVETSVRRISPTGDPLVLRVPLLKGMLVTDPERQVKDGEVVVTLGRDESEAGWSATLEPTEGAPIALQAPSGRPWSEVWVVRCGPVWQCETSGLAPVSRFEGDTLAAEFRPWPGESVSLSFRRPKGAPGRSVTIDQARLAVTPGLRLEDASLDLSVRSSRPGPLSVTLPEGAEVQELKVKGVQRPIRSEGQRLTVALEAGEQAVHVLWRRNEGLRLWHRVPRVVLDEPVVNAHVSLQLPEDRWLLAVGGPAWGPAVLFWPYLLCVALAAYGLSRLPKGPLRLAEWLLLGLGLASLPLVGALAVAGWFLVVAWRAGRRQKHPLVHDLVQIGLLLWTLLALGLLYGAVHQGLLLRPEMQVLGNDSSDSLLQWYRDRVDGALPEPWVLSVPLIVYRVAMLGWSVWLALALLRWLPWAWRALASEALWLPLRGKAEGAAPGPAPAPSEQDPPAGSETP